MALVMHVIKVPRYKDIMTGEYKTIPYQDVVTINDYLDWKKARDWELTDCPSLKEWCGVLEADMPHKYIVSYYSDFYKKGNHVYSDYNGKRKEVESIFDDLARLPKMNQVLAWLTKNVTNGVIDGECHEIPENKMRELVNALKLVYDNISRDGDKYKVDNEDIAKEYLPIMENAPNFWGPREYNEAYAAQIVQAYNTFVRILNGTNFEKETIYFYRLEL